MATVDEMLRMLREVDDLDGLVRLNKACVARIKALQDLRSRTAAASIAAGDRVQWDGKHGHQTGTVTRVKTKYAEVLADGGKNLTWNVPAGMLRPLEEADPTERSVKRMVAEVMGETEEG